MPPFQKQLAIIILHSIMDSETIHVNVLLTIASAAIAEIQLYFKKYAFLEISWNVFERVHISNDNIYRTYEQLTPFYIIEPLQESIVDIAECDK